MATQQVKPFYFETGCPGCGLSGTFTVIPMVEVKNKLQIKCARCGSVFYVFGVEIKEAHRERRSNG